MGLSLDGRSSLWLERPRSGGPQDRVNLEVERPNGAIEDIGPVTPPGAPVGSAGQVSQRDSFEPEGVSDDLSHVLFSLGSYFWPFDSTEEGDNRLSLYRVCRCRQSRRRCWSGLTNSGNLISKCTTELGGEHATHNAMSGDGNTVFFTARKCGASPPVNELFARIGNGGPGAQTVAISEPASADCALCDTGKAVLAPAYFEGASVDGSKVFFTTAQPLLGGDSSENLYEYDFTAPVGERLIRVSAGDATVSHPTAEVQGTILDCSEDGSHVYFVARAS